MFIFKKNRENKYNSTDRDKKEDVPGYPIHWVKPREHDLNQTTAPVVVKEKKEGARWPRYVLIGLPIYALIIMLTKSYLNKPPVFTSRWAIMLPGTGVTSKVAINSVGSSSTSAGSPFGISSISPLLSYQQIMTSKPVLLGAAESLGLEMTEFGAPKIKMVEQTTIIEIRMLGPSPEDANTRSYALWDTFSAQLDKLRYDELDKREFSIKNQLKHYKEQLNRSRQNLLDHQAKAEFISIDQFNDYVMRIESLRADLMNLDTTYEHKQGIVHSFSRTLGVTPKQAAEAFTLHADPIFQHHMKNYADAEADLALYKAKWGRNHPQIRIAKESQTAALSAMKKRSLALVGHEDISMLRLMNLGEQASKSMLFQDLLKAHTELEGLVRRRDVIKRNLDELKHRVKYLSEDAALLEDLEREHSLAEAVYTGAVGRIDANKTDVFASYPIVQLFIAPEADQKPTTPNPGTGIAGAIVGSIFVTLGLVLLWVRKPLYQKIVSKRQSLMG